MRDNKFKQLKNKRVKVKGNKIERQNRNRWKCI